MTYKKKLIEVAIPLEAINAASAREKSIRHGHPSTLHLWWARRPLAACRAVLFAQLVDDPSSHPDQFPTHEDQERERQRLFAIIEDLVKWENSTNEEVLERARAEIRRSCGGVLPPVYDPFSGGGSIPLEAQRLGLPAYGSDLNPVAVMIGKAMIEIPPKFKDMPPIHTGIKERSFYRNAEGLAEDVKFYGGWMREKAWERIGHLYPQVDLPKEYGGGKATVIAWIWARTVPSPDPAFADAQVPIVSSFVLSTKKGQETWIEPEVDKVNKTVSFRVVRKGSKQAFEKAQEGTKAGQATFRCIFSDAPIKGDYIDTAAENGRLGYVPMAVVAEGKRTRIYLDIDPESFQASMAASAEQKNATSEILAFTDAACRGTFASNAQGRRYGFHVFRDYFIERQQAALASLVEILGDVAQRVEADAQASGLSEGPGLISRESKSARAYAEAILVFLSFAIDRVVMSGNSLVRWNPVGPKAQHIFGRQAIAMLWDFAETNPLGSATGSLQAGYEMCSNGLLGLPCGQGEINQGDAQTVRFPEGSVLSTDPPYYHNVEYADLSDFFYVWMRAALRGVFPELFSSIATPKLEELVATKYRHKTQEAAEEHFYSGMKVAIGNAVQQTGTDFPSTIYYAFKQAEIEQDGIASAGWATFLQGVMDSGLSVVGTWPVRTEMRTRQVAMGTNALSNSVVLVCRKKEASAEVITRAEFIRALKRELPPAIGELQAANIAPADMPQSAIGPGMGVFSRYKAVLESDDSPMTVKAALQLINRELDEYLGGIQGEFDADTRFAITWFEQNGLKAGDYGTANNIATARGISVESVKHAGIVESAAGKVRILKRDEMDPDWDPEADDHLTIWECCQHLVRLHEKYGIGYEAAVMLKKYGAKAGDVRDLAYVLYSICEKRGDAKEATAYNALIADWTDLTREAATAPLSNKSGQMRFEV